MKCAYCSVHGVSGTVHEVSGSAVGAYSIVYRGTSTTVVVCGFGLLSVNCRPLWREQLCKGVKVIEMDVEC